MRCVLREPEGQHAEADLRSEDIQQEVRDTSAHTAAFVRGSRAIGVRFSGWGLAWHQGPLCAHDPLKRGLDVIFVSHKRTLEDVGDAHNAGLILTHLRTSLRGVYQSEGVAQDLGILWGL